MKIDSNRFVTLRTGQQGLRCSVGLERTEVKTNDVGKRVHYFRASDATLDRYNESIEPKGWVLDEYAKNNVICDSHRYDSIQWVIGNGVDVRVTDNGLVIGIQFSDSNPLGRMAEGMVEEGTIKSGSVGFIPLDYRQGKKGEPTRTYTRQNLLEFSLTAIPANPNALKLSVDGGYIDIEDARAAAKMFSDFCSGKATSGTDSRSKSATGDVERLLRLTNLRAVMCG